MITGKSTMIATNMLTNVTASMASMVDIMSVLCYIAAWMFGCMVVSRWTSMLRENEEARPLKKLWGLLLTSMALGALPTVMSTSFDTMLGADPGVAAVAVESAAPAWVPAPKGQALAAKSPEPRASGLASSDSVAMAEALGGLGLLGLGGWVAMRRSGRKSRGQWEDEVALGLSKSKNLSDGLGAAGSPVALRSEMSANHEGATLHEKDS